MALSTPITTKTLLPKLRCAAMWMLLSSSLFKSHVSAFPTGAGGCTPGASVGGSHLSRTPTTGSIDAYFGANALCLASSGASQCQPSSATLIVLSGTDTTLTVKGDAAPTFKGFLFKLTGTTPDGAVIDTVDYVTVPTDASGAAAISDQCTTINVGGVTHTSADEKASASAVLMGSTMEAGDYLLTVTVVVHNSESEGSVYYYSDYSFSISSDNVATEGGGSTGTTTETTDVTTTGGETTSTSSGSSSNSSSTSETTTTTTTTGSSGSTSFSSTTLGFWGSILTMFVSIVA